jgi:hypothetical protein
MTDFNKILLFQLLLLMLHEHFHLPIPLVSSLDSLLLNTNLEASGVCFNAIKVLARNMNTDTTVFLSGNKSISQME